MAVCYFEALPSHWTLHPIRSPNGHLYLLPFIMHRALHCGFHCLAVPERPLIGSAPDVPCQISSCDDCRSPVDYSVHLLSALFNSDKTLSCANKVTSERLIRLYMLTSSAMLFGVSSISRLRRALKFNSYLVHAYRFSERRQHLVRSGGLILRVRWLLAATTQ